MFGFGAKEENIVELILKRKGKKINKLLREKKIDLYTVVRLVSYHHDGSLKFLNKLNINSKELVKIAPSVGGFTLIAILEDATNINFEDLYQEALSCKHPEFITKIAVHAAKNNVDSHYIIELADKVIELNNAEWIYRFAKEVPNAPIDKLAEAIIKTNDAYYSCCFAKEVPNAPINDLINAFVTEKGAINHTNKFVDLVIKIESISFEEIARKFTATNNAELITEFAIHASKHNIDNAIIIELAQAVIATNNAECIYKFIKNVRNAPIDDLIQAIIDLNDLKYICLLVKDYHKLSKNNIKKLFDAIIRAFDIKNMPNDDITNLVAKLTLAEVFDETDFKFFLHYLTMVKCNNSLTDAGVIPAIPLPEELKIDEYSKVKN